jgi:exopolysaccharide biosynthesis polyprenyl glycosylphosphotransferase
MPPRSRGAGLDMTTVSNDTQAPPTVTATMSAGQQPTAWNRVEIRIVVDVAVLAIATATVALTTFQVRGSQSLGWLVAFSIMVFALLHGRRRRSMFPPHILDELGAVATTTALVAVTLLSVRVLVSREAGAGSQTARQWITVAVALGIGRLLVSLYESRESRRGERYDPTLIVGAGKIGHSIARRLLEHPELGLRPIGLLDDAPLEGESSGVSVLGDLSALDAVIHRYGVKRVIVSFSGMPHDALLDVMRRCQQLGVKISVVPRFFETMKQKFEVDCVGSMPLVSISPTNPRAWPFSLKYALDRVVAASLLIVLAPLFLACAFAVRVSLGRPILFRQPRVGRDGRVFTMLKFRSMQGGPEWSPSQLPPDTAPGGREGVDRQTQFGGFLRRASLDELPQLINVLRGDMSLVGPRPERPEFAQLFEQSIHRYGERHRVKAGVTGWAQVNGLRGNTSLADRADWDNYYIDNWSLLLDLRILILTAVLLISRPVELPLTVERAPDTVGDSTP